MKLRSNLNLKKSVERGLLLDKLRGSLPAWLYMASCGIPVEVIARVLCWSDKRRVTDKAMLDSWERRSLSGTAHLAKARIPD